MYNRTHGRVQYGGLFEKVTKQVRAPSPSLRQLPLFCPAQPHIMPFF